MARIPIEAISPGAVLAKDVRDRQGRLLLSSGRELTARTLESLRFWGVGFLDVLGDVQVPEAEAAVPPEILARAAAEVEEHFANAGPAHPFLDALRRLAAERRARELLTGQEIRP